MAENLLEVRDLVTSFQTDDGVLRAVDGVSFEVPTGGTIGIIGESGCGKSVTSYSVMQLLPMPPAKIERGEIRFAGRNLLGLPEREMRALRGNQMAMIFQEPMSSLNPVYTVGAQIAEAALLHQKIDRRAARARAIEMLTAVGIPAPAERVDSYPHELSGGMRQRVMIAMALVNKPKLLIADEPTTALDVTIQAQILDLLRRLQREMGMSIMLITHDLGVVAEVASEVVVMYAGKVVERGPVDAIVAAPLHPYTKGLLESAPALERNRGKKRLPTIAGIVPDLRRLPKGCRFQDRCDRAQARCRDAEPPLERAAGATDGRLVACYFPVPLEAAS